MRGIITARHKDTNLSSQCSLETLSGNRNNIPRDTEVETNFTRGKNFYIKTILKLSTSQTQK